MANKKSSIPQELFALIPSQEKGCSLNYNRDRDVYYVYRWLGTTYSAKAKRGIDRRESVGVIRNMVFTYSKNYLTKKKLQSVWGEKYEPTAEELQGRTVLAKALNTIQDSRQKGKVAYALDVILLVALLSALRGGSSAVSVALYWKQHRQQLQELIPGFPLTDISHDTINRVLRQVQKDQIQGLIEKVTQPLIKEVQRRLLHADGQAVRASYNHEKRNGRYFFNVYDSDNGLIVCHKLIDGKNNEIPVSQEIFSSFDLKNCVVTVDALNTQKEFARIVRAQQGDYCFAVKENHEKLYNTLRALFNEEDTARKQHEEQGSEHGRIEKRTTQVMSAKLLGRPLREQWAGLEEGCIVKTVTQTWLKRNDKREDKNKETYDERYFITTLGNKTDDVAKNIAQVIRRHWSVENELHWSLDTAFDQDRIQVKDETYLASRITLNKLAFNLLKKKQAQLLESEKHRYSLQSLQQLCSSPADALDTIYGLLGQNRQ